MNYVKHMNEIFQQFSMDDRLNPNHISLYLALFQEWSVLRFARKTFVSRGDVMKKAKIRSKTTYHRCITDLSKWGYIVYHPSKNSFRGSVIEMANPEVLTGATDDSREEGVNQVSAGKVSTEDDTSEENSSEEDEKPAYQYSTEGEILISARFREGQKLMPGYIDIPKSEKEVIDFFRSKKWNVVEGQKFFHHYQSIGWKKGGTIPLKDWRAAAKNWVIRGRELRAMEIPAVKLRNQDNLKISKTKHYDEPL